MVCGCRSAFATLLASVLQWCAGLRFAGRNLFVVLSLELGSTAHGK